MSTSTTGRHWLAGWSVRHIGTWLNAVVAQSERIPLGFMETRGERWAGPPLYAYALRQLLRACWAAGKLDESGAITEAVKRFEEEVPGVRDIRNTVDKFDKEELGVGGLAVAASYDDGFTAFRLRVGDHVLDIDTATEAATRMANASLAQLSRIR